MDATAKAFILHARESAMSATATAQAAKLYRERIALERQLPLISVRESRVRGSGLGAFWMGKHAIAAGEPVMAYEGAHRSMDEHEGDASNHIYALAVQGASTWIDGNPRTMESLGLRAHPCGSANHLMGKGANMKLILRKGLDGSSHSYPLLVATKIIKPDDELFWDYFNAPGTSRAKRISASKSDDAWMLCEQDSEDFNKSGSQQVDASKSIPRQSEAVLQVRPASQWLHICQLRFYV